MKIFVTGGAGFIGHNVVLQLEELGHKCFIYDSLTDYGIIDQMELRKLTDQRLANVRSPLYRGDILDHYQLNKQMEAFGPDVVIHMASFPRQKVVNSNPRLGTEVMMQGLINVLESSRRQQVERVVYVSSSMVYGDFRTGVTEDSQCNPMGLYAILKLAGEQITRDYGRRGCFQTVVVRPSAVYGPLDVTDRVVSKWIEAAFRDEAIKVNGATEQLDFTYVTDAARGITLAATVPEAAGGTYNITRGVARSLLDGAHLVRDIIGCGSVQLSPKDRNFPSRGALCIDAARRDLGFDPKVDIEQGFQLYIDHARHQFL